MEFLHFAMMNSCVRSERKARQETCIDRQLALIEPDLLDPGFHQHTENCDYNKIFLSRQFLLLVSGRGGLQNGRRLCLKWMCIDIVIK